MAAVSSSPLLCQASTSSSTESEDGPLGKRIVERLLKEKVAEGYVLSDTSCPACSTSLVKRTGPSDDLAKPSSSNLSFGESFDRPVTPVVGIPFCVACEAHVVTEESEVGVLEGKGVRKARGSILVALEKPTEEADVPMEKTNSVSAEPDSSQKVEEQAESEPSGITSESETLEADEPHHQVEQTDAVSEQVESAPSEMSQSPQVLHALVPVESSEAAEKPEAESDDWDQTLDLTQKGETDVLDEESPGLTQKEDEETAKDDGVVDTGDEGNVEAPTQKADSLACFFCMEGAPLVTDEEEQQVSTSRGLSSFFFGSAASLPVTNESLAKSKVEGDKEEDEVVPEEVEDATPAEEEPTPVETEPEADWVEVAPRQQAEDPDWDKSVVLGQPKESVSVEHEQLEGSEPTIEAEQVEDESSEQTEQGEDPVPVVKVPTAEEEVNVEEIISFSKRREIATKVLGSKMLQGYTLKATPCDKCGMPLMSSDDEIDCVVCPVLAKKAMKIVKARKDKEQKAIEARLAEEARIKEEARQLEAARVAEEERQREEARLAEEARQLEEARLAEEKVRLEEEARKLEEIRLAEEKARLEEEAKQLEEARIAEEVARLENAGLVEEARQLEEARLAQEKIRLEEAAKQLEAARLAEEKQREEEKRLTALLLEETKRLEELEQKQADQELQVAEVNDVEPDDVGPLSPSCQHLRSEALEEKRRQDEVWKMKEQIQSEVDSARIADLERATQEAELLAPLEDIAAEKQRAAEEAIAKAKAALEEVSSARREIIAKTIAKAEADAIAEAEEVTDSERTTSSVMPTLEDIEHERWALLRTEGRALMTRRMLQDWTMLTRVCTGAQCSSNPLLQSKDGTIECVVCGGSGSGVDGAYCKGSDAIVSPRSSSHFFPASSDAGINAPASHPESPTAKRSVEELKGDFEEKRNKVTKEIGKKMAKGWMLLDMSCPSCAMPLMSDAKGGPETCVLCGPVEVPAVEEVEPEEITAVDASEENKEVAVASEEEKPTVAEPSAQVASDEKKPASLTLQIPSGFDIDNEEASKALIVSSKREATTDVVAMRKQEVVSPIHMGDFHNVVKDEDEELKLLEMHALGLVTGKVPAHRADISPRLQPKRSGATSSPLAQRCPSPTPEGMMRSRAPLTPEGSRRERRETPPRPPAPVSSSTSRAKPPPRPDAVAPRRLTPPRVFSSADGADDESVASSAYDVIMQRIDTAKAQLLQGDEPLSKQLETAHLIEQLATAAVAMKKLEDTGA